MGETGALEFIKQFGILILAGVIGVGILIYGIWGVVGGERATVEIIKDDPARSDLVGFENDLQPTRSDLLYVDVAGSVEKPGVYKLPSGSRIGDALVVAGGLSASADREWVAETINLASEVKDGEKIYIPLLYRDDPSQMQSKGSSLSYKGTKVNINTATSGELDSLAGIGEARAQAIIANRPYGSSEELVSKAKIPQSVYEKIKDKISVY